MRERAELDCSAQLLRLEHERGNFERMKADAHKELQRCADAIAADRADLDRKIRNFSQDEAGFSVYMKEIQNEFREDQKNLEGVNVLREVILMLELDEEPGQIALSLRKKFGLLIPEW